MPHRARSGEPPHWVMTAGGLALIVGTLYAGRAVLVPIALALLLSFVLGPLVGRLRRLRVPKSLAVALVMSVGLLTAGATSVFVASQVVQVGRDLPTYEQTIRAKLGWIRHALTHQTVVDELGRLLGLVQGELDAARHAMAGVDSPGRPSLRVQVEPQPPSPTRSLVDVAGPLMAPMGTAAVVVLVLIFILLERGDLHDRLLRLIGGDLQRSMALADEAAHRVSRYLTTQLMVNVGYATILTVGLGLIGIPGALLWGVLAGLLRFLPYVGPVIAASLPLTLAFAVDPGWSMLLWTAGLIAALDLIVNYLVEPRLYGAQTGLTPIGVVLSAMFWAALWGGVGLVLATPLTVCLVVMSRHVPGLQFLGVLLGSEPVPVAPRRLAQRQHPEAADSVILVAAPPLGVPEPDGGAGGPRRPQRLSWWAMVRQAVQAWSDDRAPSMGAAIAYYTLFSLAPLLLIVVAVAGLIFGAEAARGALFGELEHLLGAASAQAIQHLLASLNKPADGLLSTLVGLMLVLVGATSVFAELQATLDHIWRVPPQQPGGLLRALHARVLSFGLILGLGFLLVVSLFLEAALGALQRWWSPYFGGWLTLMQGVNLAVNFGMLVALFAMIYKLMPRVHVAWADVWIGAVVTAALFTVGRALIGLYISHSAVGSAFRAAGSVVVVMVWVYYSAQIFLLGAEFTWVYAHHRGSRHAGA